MRRRESNRLIVTFLSPALLLYAVFVLGPAVAAFRFSTLRWDGLSAPVFVGLDNFRKILTPGSPLLGALSHNVYLTLVPGVFTLGLALFFAYSIHQRIRGARLFRIAFFFPNVISSVAVALLWGQVYSSTKTGLLNSLLARFFHYARPVPFTQSDRLLPALVPIVIWMATGFYLLLFLAAMENVPEEYYEAARLDGAGAWTLFRRVTLPLIWEVLVTGIIFMVISGLKIFDVVWIMENGRPTPETHTLSTLLYSRVFEEYDIGQGTAIAVVLFLLVLAATLLSRRALRRDTIQY
jgi:ABC-type sugar transport system permease subunit